MEKKRQIVRTLLKKPPEVLEYWWAPPGEPEPQRFPVNDGVVEGLSTDHPRWHVLQNEWELVVEEAPLEVSEQKKAKGSSKKDSSEEVQ